MVQACIDEVELTRKRNHEEPCVASVLALSSTARCPRCRSYAARAQCVGPTNANAQPRTSTPVRCIQAQRRSKLYPDLCVHLSRVSASYVRAPQGLFALIAQAASLDIVVATPGGPVPSRLDGTIMKSPLACSAAERPSGEIQEDDPAALAIGRIESEITGSPRWPAALDLWRRFMEFEDNDNSRQSTNVDNASGVGGIGKNDGAGGSDDNERVTVKRDVETLKFRASVVRDGRHAFNSMEASPRLGGAVLTVNPHWTVDLKVGSLGKVKHA